MGMFGGITRGWDPPRGPRLHDGWVGNLLDLEPLGSSADGPDPRLDVEGYAARNYRDVIADLETARAERFDGLRGLAAAAGLSTAAVAKAISGSVWPRIRTLDRVAAVLGAVVELDVVPDSDPLGLPELPEGLSPLVCDLLVAMHTWDRRRLGAVAVEAGVRPHTVYDLAKPDRSPSTQTLFGLSTYLGCRVVVRFDDR